MSNLDIQVGQVWLVEADKAELGSSWTMEIVASKTTRKGRFFIAAKHRLTPGEDTPYYFDEAGRSINSALDWTFCLTRLSTAKPQWNSETPSVNMGVSP